VTERTHSPADLALALRALPPFHDGRWHRAISTLDPAMGLFPFARAGLDIMRCIRLGWLKRAGRPGVWVCITREGRAVLSAATLERNHRDLVDRVQRPEQRGFGIGSAIACAIILIASVILMLTTRTLAGFAVAVVWMAGSTILLTDYACGDRSGEVD
jgi:hypothetical protein